MNNRDKYDCLIYGNGLSVLLLNQLRKVAPEKYKYEFSFSDYMNAFSKGLITNKERRELQELFHNLIDSRLATNSYDNYCNYISGVIEREGVDFEQILGRTLVANKEEKERNNAVILSIYPVMYNYWGNNLLGLIQAIFKEDYLRSFCNSVKGILSSGAVVYTTNFDSFTDNLKPEHLHGRFVYPIKREKDLIYQYFGNNGDYFYKFLWGHNGIGKRFFIQYMHDHFDDYNKYFGFDFFFDEQVHINNILIFGIGFKNSAYSSAINPYKEGIIHKGFVIDDHILERLRELQQKDQLNRITIAYYSEDDRTRFIELIKLYELERASLVSSDEFAFRI